MKPSQARHARMVAMYRRDIPVEQIARAFDAKLPAVRMALTRAGIYRPTTSGRLGTKGAAAKARVEAQKASLAEHVAEGGSITGWERANNISSGWGSQIFKKICADLGAQAV